MDQAIANGIKEVGLNIRAGVIYAIAKDKGPPIEKTGM